MKHHTLFLFATLCACAATGCTPVLDRADVEQRTTPPLSHDVSSNGIVLTHGTAVAIDVVAFDQEGERHDDLSPFTTNDEDSFDPVAEATSTAMDVDGFTRVILRASHPGKGTLTVTAIGTRGEVVIPLEVLPQSE
jgi:hypothetical protein